MDSSSSISIATEYAMQWRVVLPLPLYVMPRRRWFRSAEHHIAHESEKWIGTALVLASRSNPDFIDFRPLFASESMIPPWAAYPSYSSVTSGWRQGSGDGYLAHWIKWLRNCHPEERSLYLSRFPAPNDDRLWHDWYASVVQPALVPDGG